jgi:hypothetical protein
MRKSGRDDGISGTFLNSDGSSLAQKPMNQDRGTSGKTDRP